MRKVIFIGFIVAGLLAGNIYAGDGTYRVIKKIDKGYTIKCNSSGSEWNILIWRDGTWDREGNSGKGYNSFEEAATRTCS